MALGVRAAPFTYVAHVLAVAAAAMVLVWAIHFRGGLAIEATNKNLIFNVSDASPRAVMLDFFSVFPGRTALFGLDKALLVSCNLVLYQEDLMSRRASLGSFTS
jgi:hypothetical protein